MAEPAPRGMTVEQFLAWQEGQRSARARERPAAPDEGGGEERARRHCREPRRRAARAGPGTGYQPFTGDGSVETRPGQIRRPDVGVACGPRDPNGTKAALPRLVVEVLSPSTRDFDTFKKLDEYKETDSLEYIVLIEPNEPVVFFWRRNARAWVEAQVRGLDGEIDMPEIGVILRMAAI